MPRARGAQVLLSFAQERLWFLEQLEPASVVYNICRAYRLLGNLNSPALEASLNEIVSRHETLRTAFRLIDGAPIQVVQPAEGISIDFTDLRSEPERERDPNIRRQIETAALHPFDLNSGLLFRCALMRLDEQQHILVLTTHHSAADAWSMGILTRELWTLYDAFLSGKPSPLEPLPVQYSDYAVWQREWLQGDLLDAQLGYWKERLNDLSVLNLPTDRPRKPRQSFHGARVAIELPHELTSALNEMSHRFAVTPFMTLLAAFQVLLYRYTGQDDVVIGSPIANRRRPEIEGLIGFFVNTLVLRADLSGNPSFSELLIRVRDLCVGSDSNQDLPFEKLVQEFQPERDQSRNPLFQIMFVLQNATRSLTGIPGLRIEPLEVAITHSPFDLSLFLREREGKYVGQIEYSTDLYNYDTIERMVAHYETLLEAVVADPDQSIATLPILTEAERHQILVAWNDTAADYPKDKCIHQLFEEQVERTPGAIAVEFADQQITYRELNRRANQLAHYLISLGIGSEKLVGTCVERSIEMVVGLLGILKAGGAYVPLDPAYPEERLRFMLEDAQVSILLTQAKLLEDREPRPEDGDPRSSISPGTLRTHLDPLLQVVCLDRDWPWITQQADDNPCKPVNSNNLAYVIYTSGSAGKPKGVQIEHRSVINCLHSLADRLGLSEHDVLLAVTTISFDISVLELFLPLFIGGKLVVASRDQAVDGTALAKLLANSRATAMQATPSSWRLLIDTGWEGSPGFKILCGGEALPRDLAEALLKRSEVWNLYGPTESTIWSTVHKVEHGEGPVLIGRPIANTRIYILDSHCQPVPIGVHGDLYIGGDGLARGYWNDPELMAERSIPDPFSDRPNARLYRTGDRARYRPDGNIEFLGRTDTQVKIRGHRIELGEIESVLMQHPAVKETVVVPFDEPASNSDNRKSKTENPKSLVAYVVSHDKPEPTISELREFLKGRLPDYMIPSWFLFFDALPLTSNGKLDRSALPPPDGKQPALSHGFVEPRTEIEELVAQVWRDVLNREKIGVYDNFFDLGGHSLLAAHVTGRLQETFNKAVTIRVLFDSPTVAAMARELELILRDGRSPEPPPIVRVPRDKPLPLSLNQEQLWRVTQMMPGTHYFNMPYVYHLSGDLNAEALERALKEIIRRHEALRTVFRSVDGQPVQIIQPVPDSFLNVIDLRSAQRDDLLEQARSAIMRERVHIFDIAKGPQIRVKLLRLTDKENLLLITVHHIVADHWSMQVFRHELITLYEAFSQGRSSPLPEPVIQFADYAVWERELLNHGLFDDQLVRWTDELALASSTPDDQVRHTDSGRSSFLFSRHSIEISEPVVERLRLFAKQEKSTVFHLLLTALVATLYVATGEQNIRIGALVANRGRPETENVIGHFLNTLILVTHVSSHFTLHQLFAHIRKTALHAHNHQGFPIEKLMRELESKHGIHRASLFPVLVNYRKDNSTAVNVAGLTFARWNIPRINSVMEHLPATYDWIFNFNESSTSLTCDVNAMDESPASVNMEHVIKRFNRFLEILPSDRDSLLGEYCSS